MLSEEEKKAIEKLNEILKEWQEIINIEDKTEREIEMSMYMEEMPFEEINTVLNLITKLQKENKYIHKELDKQQTTINNYAKENEEKNKQIDLMAEYMEENMDEYQLDEIYAKQYNCNGMERNWIRGKEKEVKDIKQYFERKVKHEN